MKKGSAAFATEPQTTPTVGSGAVAETPAQRLLKAVDACASVYDASQIGWLGEVAQLRLTYHQLRMLPVVASYRTAA